jgi:hypothetical protein
MFFSWVVMPCGGVGTYMQYVPSRLGDVVFSLLATGPKGRRFEPGQGDGFLRR